MIRIGLVQPRMSRHDPAMRSVLTVLLLALAGCGPSVSQIVTAEGRPAYEFRCGGLLDSKTDCNLKASEMCPYGYHPVASSSGRLTAVCANRPVGKATR